MKKQVFIVEDDDDIGTILKRILDKAGYNTELTKNGDKLLSLDGNWPDLIILDKRLSGRDGLEICRKLRKKRLAKNIPLIMISATPNLEDKAKKAGASAFLEKPFSIFEIINLVNKLIQ